MKRAFVVAACLLGMLALAAAAEVSIIGLFLTVTLVFDMLSEMNNWACEFARACTIATAISLPRR